MVTFRDSTGFTLDITRIGTTDDYRVTNATPDGSMGVWVDVPAFVLVGIGHALSMLHPDTIDPVDVVVLPQRAHHVNAWPAPGDVMVHHCTVCGYRGEAVPTLPCPGPPIVGDTDHQGTTTDPRATTPGEQEGTTP